MFAARALCRRRAAGRGISSDERPLAGGALKKMAPPPGRTASPEVSIQNVGRTPAKPAFTEGNKKSHANDTSGQPPRACVRQNILVDIYFVQNKCLLISEAISVPQQSVNDHCHYCPTDQSQYRMDLQEGKIEKNSRDKKNA